ncbi:hypothetical protein OEZ85_012128 [Tetradesmus obliquus]|uniref:Endonuclease/exonuclease/phosphatase domain-containing protein n=1 Tax=Tetradesmus obliquus TaxID=3088 RepID=A0ABY8TT46_TETOB|nr:hypothetical protein OEZ85_012128 [Tetradesmus obliquus]
MRVLTWNVNGIRSVVAKFGNMKALLEALSADIVCLQETKAQLDSELAVVQGWESFYAYSTCASGSGYAGVATYCRTATASVPVAVEHGLTGTGTTAGARLDSSAAAAAAGPSPVSVMLCEALGVELEQLAALDREGRALITDHGPFLLVNLYGPAITSEERVEERMAFKMLFYKVLELRLQQWLAAGRACLVVGDLNISPAPIDSCHPPADFDAQRSDRLWLQQLLAPHGPGVVDAFRLHHPSRRNAFTCWNTVTGARVNNYGTRIDHILAAGRIPAGLSAAATSAAPKGPPGVGRCSFFQWATAPKVKAKPAAQAGAGRQAARYCCKTCQMEQ